MRFLTIGTMILLLFSRPLPGQDRNASSLGDHPLVARFPDSQLEEMEVLEDANYSLVLGSLHGRRQQVVPEDSLRLRGDVTKILYQVPQAYTGEEVQRYFQEQFLNKDYTVMFSCAGRSCGSSNYWANDIFGNRILYGSDRNQYFTALRVGEEDNPRAHLALYVITRPNRRIYAYLEIVEEDLSRGVLGIASPEMLQTLNAQGSVALPSVSFASDSELSAGADLRPAVELIQSIPDRNFYVVAHLDGSAPLEELLQRSTQRAERVRQTLVELGVAPERLQARGVGPLAPACNIANCAERVELVLAGNQ